VVREHFLTFPVDVDRAAVLEKKPIGEIRFVERAFPFD
jgi:hypothetical protein